MKNQIPLINKGYNKKELQILLEQYKLMSECADKITDKRQNTNKFYLGINSFILAVASYIAIIKINYIPLIISSIGFIISIVWRRNIDSYKALNAAKFKVIHELEEYLPANIYRKEDEYLKKGYYKLTSIEKWVPFIFSTFYASIIIIIVINYILN